MAKILKNIFMFYYSGFRNLTSTGKKLWLLVLVKATVFLVILNIFFPDLLAQYDNDKERSEAVANSLLGN